MDQCHEWSTPVDRPGSHLEFFLKIQHVHGQKMIDPQLWSKMIDCGGDCYTKDLLPPKGNYLFLN